MYFLSTSTEHFTEAFVCTSGGEAGAVGRLLIVATSMLVTGPPDDRHKDFHRQRLLRWR